MPIMPKHRLPHVVRERTNRGKLVWYFRIGKGKRIRLPDAYGSPDFMAAYHAVLIGKPVDRSSQKRRTGSIAWLIGRYRESSAWLSLSEATRYQRDRIFAGITDKVGDQPYSGVSAKTIRNGREARQATPFMANNYLRAIKGLFAWAVEAEYLTENPAKDVKELATKTSGHEPWTVEDIRKYEGRWPLGTRERVWLHVLCYTGLRLGDACTVGWQHVKDGYVSLRAEKTRHLLEFPLLPPLLESLKAGPTGDLTFICNSRGRPFVKESFGNAFRDACRAAGIEGKSAHGLRKMLASLAAELGASEELLQAWFGWQTSRMSAIYTRAASKKVMAGRLGDLFQQNEFGTNSPRANSNARDKTRND
jgi:integrase